MRLQRLERNDNLAGETGNLVKSHKDLLARVERLEKGDKMEPATGEGSKEGVRCILCTIYKV